MLAADGDHQGTGPARGHVFRHLDTGGNGVGKLPDIVYNIVFKPSGGTLAVAEKLHIPLTVDFGDYRLGRTRTNVERGYEDVAAKHFAVPAYFFSASIKTINKIGEFQGRISFTAIHGFRPDFEKIATTNHHDFLARLTIRESQFLAQSLAENKTMLAVQFDLRRVVAQQTDEFPLLGAINPTIRKNQTLVVFPDEGRSDDQKPIPVRGNIKIAVKHFGLIILPESGRQNHPGFLVKHGAMGADKNTGFHSTKPPDF
jgi:hypothetical protein